MDEEQKTVNECIDDEFIYQLQSLKDLKFGSQEHERAVNGVVALRELAIADAKVDIEWSGKEREMDIREKELDIRSNELDQAKEKAEREMDIREKELDIRSNELDQAKEEAKLDRICDVALGAASIAIPAWLFSYWQRKGFKFEETGILTSNTLRNVTQAFGSWIRRMF